MRSNRIFVLVGAAALLAIGLLAARVHPTHRVVGARPERSSLRPSSAAREPALGTYGGAHEPASAPSGADLEAVIEQVHFAFRESGAGHEGGHATYRARAESGVVEITPLLARTDEAGRGVAPAEGPSLSLSTRTIARGERELGASAPNQRVSSEGRLAIDRGAAIEHWRNGEQGAEQSWSFASRPEGAGELRVEVEAKGAGFVGKSASGLHFAGADGVGVRCGNATWIDARGEETAVPAEWSGERIVFRVPEAVVERSAFPAVLDPVIGPEIGVDQPILEPLYRASSVPYAMAAGATGSFVAWIESNRVVGTRLGASGEILDPLGIFLGDAIGTNTFGVVHGAGGYLAYWGSFGTLLCAFLPEDGTTPRSFSFGLDQGVPATAVFGARPIATNGDELALFFTPPSPAPCAVSAIRFGSDGVPRDASPLAVASLTTSCDPPIATGSSSQWWVAFNANMAANGRDLMAARLSAAGVALDPTGVAIATGTGEQVADDLETNGTDALLVLRDQGALQARRIGANGQPLEASGLVLGANAGTNASVERLDGAYVVVWSESAVGARAIRISDAGALDAPQTIAPAASYSGASSRVPTSSNGDAIFLGFMVVPHRGALAIGIASLETWGAPLTSPITVARLEANGETAHVVGSIGQTFVVAWIDDRDVTGYGIFAVRIDASGQVLDPSGVRINSGYLEVSSPAMACSTTECLVTWAGEQTDRRYQGLYAARLSAGGKLLDRQSVALATEFAGSSILGPTVQRFTSIAGVAVVARDPSEFFNYFAIFTQSLDGNSGAPMGIRIHASSMGITGEYLDLAYNPNPRDARRVPLLGLFSSSDGTIYSTTDNAGVAAIDVFKLDGAVVSFAAAGQGGILVDVIPSPGAAHSALLVWRPQGVPVAQLRFIDASANHVAISTVDVPLTPVGVRIDLDGAWVGTNYLVSWSTGDEVVGIRVGSDGAPLDADSFSIASSAFKEINPRVVANDSGLALVTYRRPTSNWGDPSRLAARTVCARSPDGADCDPLPPGGPADGGMGPDTGGGGSGGCAIGSGSARADGATTLALAALVTLAIRRRRRAPRAIGRLSLALLLAIASTGCDDSGGDGPSGDDAGTRADASSDDAGPIVDPDVGCLGGRRYGGECHELPVAKLYDISGVVLRSDVRGDFLYLVLAPGNVLWRFSLVDGAATQLYVAPTTTTVLDRMRIEGDSLFFVERDGATRSLREMVLPDGAPTTLQTAFPGTLFAVDAGYVYWPDPSGIWRAARTPAAVPERIVEVVNAFALAVDDTNVYFVSGPGTLSLFRARKSGGDSPIPVAVVGSAVNDFSNDMYVTSSSIMVGGGIGGQIVVSKAGQVGPSFAIAAPFSTDGDQVFWAGLTMGPWYSSQGVWLSFISAGQVNGAFLGSVTPSGRVKAIGADEVSAAWIDDDNVLWRRARN